MIEWQAFSERLGERVVEAEFICAADDIGVILVSGPDAREFLQNQLSNDIGFIDEQHWQLSSLSTPKGRLLGIFRVVQVSNGYLLLSVREMVLPLLENLFHYIVGAQLQLADASDYFARFAVVTAAAEIHGDTVLPSAVGEVVQSDRVITLRLEPLAEQQRLLVMSLDAGEAIALWKRYSERLTVADYSSWRLAEIRCGIPSLYPETSGEFVLQMANLALLGGVSFKKGCYPGQEIVARTHYLGKLKRRMFLAEIDTDQLPVPGTEMVIAGATTADGSGKLVDAAFDAEGLCHCLYIARIERAESGELRLLDQPAAVLRNVDLPYPMEI